MSILDWLDWIATFAVLLVTGAIYRKVDQIAADVDRIKRGIREVESTVRVEREIADQTRVSTSPYRQKGLTDA